MAGMDFLNNNLKKVNKYLTFKNICIAMAGSMALYAAYQKYKIMIARGEVKRMSEGQRALPAPQQGGMGYSVVDPSPGMHTQPQAYPQQGAPYANPAQMGQYQQFIPQPAYPAQYQQAQGPQMIDPTTQHRREDSRQSEAQIYMENLRAENERLKSLADAEDSVVPDMSIPDGMDEEGNFF